MSWRNAIRNILTKSWWMRPAPARACSGRIRRSLTRGRRRDRNIFPGCRRKSSFTAPICSVPAVRCFIPPVRFLRRKMSRLSHICSGRDREWKSFPWRITKDFPMVLPVLTANLSTKAAASAVASSRTRWRGKDILWLCCAKRKRKRPAQIICGQKMYSQEMHRWKRTVAADVKKIRKNAKKRPVRISGMIRIKTGGMSAEVLIKNNARRLPNFSRMSVCRFKANASISAVIKFTMCRRRPALTA